MSEPSGAVAVAVKRARREYSPAEKLRMVEATLEAGASVARVAQANGVNPNLVFVWRKLHREGRLVVGNNGAMKLLPVMMTESPLRKREREAPPAFAQAGTLHIDLPRGRARIEGLDAACLRVALEMLLQ